jgi:thymidylate kinase
MIILEGTDAVGKTSVINNLSNYKLLDRDKNICRLFDFNVSLVDRANKLKKYLDSNENYVIFLVNNDKDELEKRIQLRETADEFDKYAYLYNLLYLETYLYLKQKNLLGGKLFMVDCTGLSLERETIKVKKIIDSI